MIIIYKIKISLRHLAKAVYNKGMKTKDNVSKSTKGRISKDYVFKELCKLDQTIADTDLKRVRISTLQYLVEKLGG